MKVVYNGVTIEYASITDWDETAEYDESGMNLVANKITITVEGSVFPAYVPPEATNVALDSPGAATSFGFRLNYCLRQLSMPRRIFSMYNPITKPNDRYFVAYPIDTTGLPNREKRNVDVNGGPKPRSVKVLQMCNEFARISFTIEVTKIRCLAGEVGEGGIGMGIDPTQGYVVSNRFWTDETIDSNFYVTRTFTGKLRISSPNKSVHYYRNLYYPPLEDGFRRDSVRFSESQDGLSLSYVVTDKQVRCAAPYPATSISGSCSFSITNQSVMNAAFQLSMIGRPDAPKKALLQRCIDAFLNKTRQFQEAKCNTMIQSFNVSENIGDPPSVSLSAKLLITSLVSTKETTSADVMQCSIPGLNAISSPPEWGPLTIGERTWYYRRIESPTPNPYGYNVYYCYEDEDFLASLNKNSQNESTEDSGTNETGGETAPSEGSETEDEPDPNAPIGGSGTSSVAARGYIKCMATAPCYVQTPRYVESSSIASEIDEAKTTRVIEEENIDDAAYDHEGGIEKESGAQPEAVSFPYTLYKSDITYFTDLSRIVLPKARSVAKSSSAANGSESSPETDYSSYSLSELKAALESQETSLETAEDEYDLYRMDAENSGMMTQEEIDAYMASYQEVIDAIKKEIAAIKREMDSRSSVRVVQVAQPVPKARVIIEAERFGRLPEMPDPEEIITTTGDDPITFTCLKAETQLCDPRAARNTNESVSYYVIGTYEYAMSRAYKKGDEVWLLQNPTFADACYYPMIVDTYGNTIPDVAALTTMYDGRQLNHAVVEEGASGSGGEGNGGGGSGGSGGSGDSGSGEPEPDFNAD